METPVRVYLSTGAWPNEDPITASTARVAVQESYEELLFVHVCCMHKPGLTTSPTEISWTGPNWCELPIQFDLSSDTAKSMSLKSSHLGYSYSWSTQPG